MVSRVDVSGVAWRISLEPIGTVALGLTRTRSTQRVLCDVHSVEAMVPGFHKAIVYPLLQGRRPLWFKLATLKHLSLTLQPRICEELKITFSASLHAGTNDSGAAPAWIVVGPHTIQPFNPHSL